MKKLNPNNLPYLTALTTAVMLTRAGVNYFGPWGWVIGPLAGLVGSLSLAIAGSRITMIAAKRKGLAYAALAFMLILSPIVIYLSEPNPTKATIAWALFPDAAILLASVVTGQSLIAQETPPQGQVTGTQVARKSRKSKGQVARKPISDNDLLSYLQANAGASQQQVADHFQVSRQAIGQRVKRLYETNQIR